MLGAYFFKAHFQVVLRLLLIVRKRLVDEELLFNVDLSRKNWFETENSIKVMLLDLQKWNSQVSRVYCGCIPVTPKSPL